MPEEYFDWRAGEITRLEAFCDVVFGFAITLLVVSLEVPHSYAELIAAMRGFFPFAACFAQLILIWRTHYKFSRRYGLEDPYTVFLNVVLLFLVLFYVYPLKFVFSMLFLEITAPGTVENMSLHEGSVLMRVYAIGFASVFLLFALMYAHAYKLRQALGLDAVEAQMTKASVRENVVLGSIGLLSFVVAFKSPSLAGFIYFLIAPALTIHGMITGKQARLMSKRASPTK